jgi:hypothetical protein
LTIAEFELQDDNSVIIVNAVIEDKFELKLAIDTAATHTTIDSNILFLTGYELKKIGEVEVETANGIIVNEIYEVKEITLPPPNVTLWLQKPFANADTPATNISTS